MMSVLFGGCHRC